MQKDREEFPPLLLLDELAERSGCRFTIEVMHDTWIDAALISIKPFEVKKTLSVKDVEEMVVEKWKNANIRVRHFTPKDGSPVVHIIDKDLEDAKGYGLNTKVSLTFEGELVSAYPDKGLLGAIRKQVDNVRVADSISVTLHQDYFTKVVVAAHNESVREILTGCLPDPYTSNVLWTAETIRKDGTLLTYVGFSGPPKGFSRD